MTVPSTDFDIKLNKFIEPNVRLMRVQPKDLKVTLGQILTSLSSRCWIATMAPFLQSGYQVRANGTIEKLSVIFANSISSGVKNDAGEFVVSELSRSAIVNELKYLDIPLGELFKQKRSGNPGFDFFTANGSLILFGEAKYIDGKNAYSSACEQLNRFISEKRDEADIPDLQNFVSQEALIRSSHGDRGYIAGFSSTAMSDDVLERHLMENRFYKALPKTNEIICVAVDVR